MTEAIGSTLAVFVLAAFFLAFVPQVLPGFFPSLAICAPFFLIFDVLQIATAVGGYALAASKGYNWVGILILGMVGAYNVWRGRKIRALLTTH